MAFAQSVIGLLGVALLVARLAFAFGTGRRAWAYAAVATGLVLLPLGAMPLAAYVRGVTGDLSVTTIVVLAVGFVRGGVEPEERRALSRLIVLAAIILYPMALGLGSFDPYRIGFAPSGTFLLTLVVTAALGWLRHFHVVLTCVVLAVSAHALGIMESDNLWDHLVDPWLALASIYDLLSPRRKS